jgi:uncharacterized protein (DUF488 family)
VGQPGARAGSQEASGLSFSQGERPAIYTVGHSTRSLAELVEVLSPVGVRCLLDVRTAPGSRRHPQFGRAALEAGLGAAGIVYSHEAALGGFRRPRPEWTRNAGWENAAFRGYADHMRDEDFVAALGRLEAAGREQPTAFMCAEAQWWRCHRRLIADALVVRGWRVLHLGLQAEPAEHELTEFAVVGPGCELSYPPPQLELA